MRGFGAITCSPEHMQWVFWSAERHVMSSMIDDGGDVEAATEYK